MELPQEVIVALLHPEAQLRLAMWLLGAGDRTTYTLRITLEPIEVPISGPFTTEKDEAAAES